MAAQSRHQKIQQQLRQVCFIFRNISLNPILETEFVTNWLIDSIRNWVEFSFNFADSEPLGFITIRNFAGNI